MAKFAHDNVVPDEKSALDKKQQVAEMFDNIAFRYDFLNRFLSVGIDRSWRKKAIQLLKDSRPQYLLDVATGTADMALLAHKMLNPKQIAGIDISQGMLQLGRKKIDKAGLSSQIKLYEGDSETINFPDETFDAITVAFGVRNFAHLEKGLTEMRRVLKQDGKLVILEFSRPSQKIFKFLYNFYMNKIAPGIGNFFSKNKTAYAYLNHSVQAFPEREQFIKIMQQAGYQDTHFKTLSLGICSIYCGRK